MLVQPGTPCRRWPSRERGTFNAGRNVQKRQHRENVAKLAGAPGGWKKALRQLQAMHRESGARTVPPHRSA